MNNIFIKSLKFEKIESGACYGQFVIDSLKINQGITIGNQLRRVLLGEVGGIAISAVRIPGPKGEFSTIKGVREDILEILLNLKGVVFKRKTDSTNNQLGKLIVDGPKVITANSIELPPILEVVNPNHYIATLSKLSRLELEFKLEYGTGYKLASKAVNDEDDNYLQLDTIFMPVQKVNFRIENIYNSSTIVSERLFLDIWTNGSILPEEALKSASQIIINLFTSLLHPEEKPETQESELTTEGLSIEPYSNVTIEELHLSVRSYNCLKKAQIHTIGNLLQYSPEKLQELKNFGRKSADEVFLKLKDKLGIILK